MKTIFVLLALLIAVPAFAVNQPISNYTGAISASSVTAGDGTNQTVVDSTGTVFEGTATVWDDIQGNLIGRRLSSAAGKVDYDYAENRVKFQPGGSLSVLADMVGWNIQMFHSATVDESIECHVHWEQTDATAREFTLQYRVQDNGAAKTTAWTTTAVSTQADEKFTYVSGTLNQISDLISIPLTGIGLSAIIQVQAARTDSVTGDIYATFIDCHFSKDQQGSAEEYVK